MGLLDGLGKWLKNEFDQISGQPTPQPAPAPQPTAQPWHAPMALPGQQIHAPTPAPVPTQPHISAPQPPQTPSQPPQIKLQPNAYPNVDPNVRQQIISGTHFTPQQKQTVLQNLNNTPKPFNPIKAGVQSLGEGATDIAKGIAEPIINTAKVPIDAAILGGAKLSGGKYMADAAQQQLSQDAGNNVFYNPLTQKTADILSTTFYEPRKENEIAQAHAANVKAFTDRFGDTPQVRNYAETLASANDQQIYNNTLAQQGLTPSDSALKVAWRVGAPVVAGLAQAPLMATGVGAGAEAADLGLEPVLKSAVGYGALGGATNVLGTAANPNATPLDYAKAFGEGFTGGALMPLGGAAIHAGVPLAVEAAKTGAAKLSDFMSAPAAQAAEKATGIARQNIINENEANTLRDFADYKTGDYKPDIPTVNNLLKQARNAAETAGIDVTSGSPHDITDRIYDYLSKRTQFINTHDAIMQGGYVGGLPDESVGGNGEGFKYKTESGGGTRYYNTLNEDNSFQDINGVRHPIQSNATFYVANYDGTGETRAFKVEDISNQANFNNLIKKYGSKGNLLNVEVDESPALNTSRSITRTVGAPQIKIDRTKLQGKALETPNRELTIASGTRTETPQGSIRISRTQPDRASLSSEDSSLPEGISAAERASKLRELGLPDDLGSYSEHTPKPLAGANLSQDEINRMVDEDHELYKQNEFPAAGGANMKPLSDRAMRDIVIEAKRRSDAERANVVQRHAILDNAIRNGVAKGEDRLFFEAVEHPEQIETILQNVKNPDKFLNAVDEMRKFNDYAAQRTIQTGTPLNIRQNYLRHNVDLSDPEQLARYLELARARGRLSTPGYSKERIFDDLNDLERNGFNLKYNDARDLAKDYANSVSGTVSRNALVNHLKQNAPGHITTVDTEGGLIPTDANGREFMTGRSNGLQRTFMSPQLSEHVARYIEPLKIGKVAKSIDVANQTLKQSTLALGGFHDINVSKRYITQEIASGLTGEPKRLLNAVVNSAKQDAAFWSKDYFANELAKYRESGLLDRATHDGNLTLNKTLDTGSLEKAVNDNQAQINIGKAKQIAMLPHNVNEFIHEFLFGRKIPLMKLQTLQSEMERYNIPLKGELTPEQRTKLVALTDQINNMYGGINKGLIAQTGAGRYIQRQLMLAPDFTGGNINSVVNMVHGDAKGLAWRQNMGNYLSSIVMATVATGLVAAATGQNGAQAAAGKLKKMLTPNSGEFLSPSIDLPYTDAKGNHLVVTMPGSPVEEVAKLRDPAHFLISRGGSLPRLGTELATNQNYYGQPLVDPYENPNPTMLDDAKAVAGSVLPIPIANGMQLANGKQNVATTVLNTAGLRVSKDPSDPKVQQTQQYFDEYNKLVNALNPNERAALQVVQPTQKDRNGNYVIAPTVFDTPDRAETLLRFPNVLNGMTALNRNLAAKGQAVDPFYTELSPEQQRAALARETINKNNTQQLTAWDQQNPWYKQFQQDRSVFYNSLPPTDPNKPKNPIQPPIETSDIQALYNQADQLTDPKAKAQFYAAHPELTGFQQQMAEYTNKVLTASGLTPLKLPPVADKDTQSYMSTYMAANPQQRAAMKAGNPEGYNKMQAYMQNVSEYEVAKNGALDQLQGQTPNQSLLKGINSLASYDMLRNPDGSLALKYGSVNPGATGYGSVAALPQPGATQNGVGGHSAHKKTHHIYMKTAKRIKVFHPRREKKIYLQTPVSPIKIRNRINKHVGIHRTTYL